MTSFLVLYGTGEGQTAKVADRIVDTLTRRGHAAESVDVESSSNITVDVFDAVVVGSSIHVGRHNKAVRGFVLDNLEALEELPTAFFQISLSSAIDDEEGRAESAGYVDSFLEETDWEPDRIGVFGGALRYSKYGFLKRLMMKRIAKEATGDTDTSRDYEYTDWDEVDAFADDFAVFVEGRLGGKN
ncbi:MAG: menaquinone-dependent protoporphyrinogen IX dehydrogenase [Halobacteriales archaeon]|nr:menaquinone-dependent protoporphyrinogen IX dehydrogenase [Halobacteriales archaeon]